jgi:DNA modification methylase
MIQVKEEFKKLIPALTVEEFKQLESNCIAEGIREAILTWNGFIVDGHNRYEIATKWGLEYQTKSKYFKDENAVREWMILNQFGRRNLSNYQRSVLALELESVFSERAKENLKVSGENFGKGMQISANPNIKSSITPFEKCVLALEIHDDLKENFGKGCQKSDKPIEIKPIEIKPIDTRKELAKVANVSHDTIAKVKVIEAKATPEVKALLSTGEVSINQAYQEIKKEEKKINFEINKLEFEKEIKPINTKQNIILGDSVVVLPTLNKNSFDLLLSDPPYGMDFKSGWNSKDKIANDKIEDTVLLFENVLRESVPLLKDDAHFYLFGNINYMEEIKPIIEKYLNLKNILIWDRGVIGMGDLKTYGASYDVVYFGYNKKWKDLKGTRDRDILKFNRVTPSANIHPTEKPLDLLEYLIKKSTNENDKVLEPFAGGGSTLLACKNTNRLCTGIEIEEKYYNLINSRI